PMLEFDEDSEGGSVRYDSLTESRDIRIAFTDPDGDLGAASAPDPRIANLQERLNVSEEYGEDPANGNVPAAGDHARVVVGVLDSRAGGDGGDASAQVLLEVRGDDSSDWLVQLHEGAPWSSSDPFEDAATRPISATDPLTCSPGENEVVEGIFWTLDCAQLDLEEISGGDHAGWT